MKAGSVDQPTATWPLTRLIEEASPAAPVIRPRYKRSWERCTPDDDVWPKRRSQSHNLGPVPSMPEARLTSLSKTFQEPARVADKPTEVHVRFGSNRMS